MSHSITITDDLYKDIKDYCELNNLKISNLCCDLLKKAMTELKYGDIPFGYIKVKEGPLVGEEIIPVIPMSEPKGVDVLAKINEISESNKENTESEQKSRHDSAITENQKNKEEIKTKTKKTRILN